MSDDSTAPAETTEAPAQAQQAAEVDWKAKAREWERRAKENKAAADRLTQIEEASKTEAQKLADRLAAAEKDAEEARRDALRFRIASKFSIGDEDAALFLTGSDEDTLTKQAQRLADREAERKRQGNVVPREGSHPTTTESNEAQFARNLFSPS